MLGTPQRSWFDKTFRNERWVKPAGFIAGLISHFNCGSLFPVNPNINYFYGYEGLKLINLTYAANRFKYYSYFISILNTIYSFDL